jgi:hypothetical protein
MTKAKLLGRADEVEAEAMKAAQAWNICGEPARAEAVLASAHEEAKELRWVANLHPKARQTWIIRNWGKHCHDAR